MCGIVGYTGNRPAQTVLLNCLAKLEYRGYDSCGIALADHTLTVHKNVVRVDELAKSLPDLVGFTGIGHTRWATHGKPCQLNAHPHTDCTGKIAVVHNGVINNYQILRQQLTFEGHNLISETDTEVLPHLIEKYYRGNLQSAVMSALKEVEGSYAIAVLAEGEPGIIVARKDSPLILGIGDQENFIASDVPAILDYTNRIIYLENDDVGVITPDIVKIYQNGREINREVQQISWATEQAQKCGYEHFMLKEIHEQPRIIRDAISEYLSNKDSILSYDSIKGNPRIVLLLACGTSYHAALIGEHVGQQLINIGINAEIASEFNYCQRLRTYPMVIGITQSGETADTLKAMRKSKKAGSSVVAITNVFSSTASKIADHTIYIKAGPEISVAATKSFTAQLIALYWLALLSSSIETRLQNDLIMEFRQIPDKVQRVLAAKEQVAEYTVEMANYEHVFYIGRGMNYAIALEGALKLKEISYIHSEAWAGGEIKHGSFALLSKTTPVVAIITHDQTYEAMLTNIKEIKARGSPVLAIAEEGDHNVSELADYVIPVPRTSQLFSPFVNAVAVQLLAYYTARQRNCPIDFPRNLAKSVTVE